MLLFPDDTLVLAEDEICDESFLVVISHLLILGYSVREENFWVGNDLAWLWPPIDISAKTYGILEVKRRLALGELQILLRLKTPSTKQVQSVAG